MGAVDHCSYRQKEHLLYLTETKRFAKSTFKVHLFAIKFLYQKTLGRQWPLLQLTRVRSDKRLPVVLSQDEVWSLLDQVRRPQARMSLTLMYTCGLRICEAVNLRIDDIDSRRKVTVSILSGFLVEMRARLWYNFIFEGRRRPSLEKEQTIL